MVNFIEDVLERIRAEQDELLATEDRTEDRTEEHGATETGPLPTDQVARV